MTLEDVYLEAVGAAPGEGVGIMGYALRESLRLTRSSSS
jgi:hypothetical protein